MTLIYVLMGLWLAYNVYADFRDERIANDMAKEGRK